MLLRSVCRSQTILVLGLLLLLSVAHAFAPTKRQPTVATASVVVRQASSSSSTATTASFIDTELRGAAMRLHTRAQAPKEGQAPAEPAAAEKYIPTHADYLQFLVDSQHVFQALEDVVNERDELAVFRNTGLERTTPLATDIDYLVKNYKLALPKVGKAGTAYAGHLRQIQSIPEFMCHFYNFYFAHTAGGRMIGKQMSSLLLDGLTLEFYKWDGDLNKLKATVKDDIEAMAAAWSEEERSDCVNATPKTFQLAGAINKYLSGNAEE